MNYSHLIHSVFRLCFHLSFLPVWCVELWRQKDSLCLRDGKFYVCVFLWDKETWGVAWQIQKARYKSRRLQLGKLSSINHRAGSSKCASVMAKSILFRTHQLQLLEWQQITKKQPGGHQRSFEPIFKPSLVKADRSTVHMFQPFVLMCQVKCLYCQIFKGCITTAATLIYFVTLNMLGSQRPLSTTKACFKVVKWIGSNLFSFNESD